MAKKVLTPEQQEIKSIKKAKRSQNWTKFWAIVLALVLTLGIAFLGRSQGKKNSADVAAGGNTAQTQPETESSLARGENAVSEGETVTDAEGNVTVGLSKADAIKLLNDATAVAANGSYDWNRTCEYEKTNGKDLIVTTSRGSDATDTLDGIIHQVDSNASLGSVVGNFIGIGSKDGKAKGGKFVADENGGTPDEKYLLKAMSLDEASVKDFVQEADVYKFQLNPCDNPKKDGGNSLHRATNDFITHEEVSQGIKDGLGGLSSLLSLEKSNVTFSNIVVSATIKGGKLTNLEISYDFSAELNLKATLVGINGNGKAKTKIVYSNIA